MYSQLRTQYPTASLTSDLLVAEPSHYVVQAVIKIGESALATGLSAASTVEVAEDQARARALMILGISVHDFPADVQLQTVQERPTPPAQLNPAAQPTISDSPPQSELWDEEWNWPQEEEESFGHEAELEMPSPQESPMPPGLDDLPRPTSRAKGSQKSRRKTPEKSQEKPSKGRRTKPKAPVAPPEPIDLSDIIAQTDIELRRLGWSHTEGRRFLEDAYGKRSRQQLTDSELLEFLEYLKVQSRNQDQPF